MVKFWGLLLLILAVLDSRGQSSPLKMKVDQVAGFYMTHKNAAGISIGILKGDSTFFYHYGEVEKGSGRPPEDQTIFEIGSISKTFTATLLAMAVGEGKVRLDDPVNKYLPDSIPILQYEGRAITLKDLSNHTSGIPRMPSNFARSVTDIRDPYKHYSIDDLYAYLRRLSLNRKPGEHYEYSNTAVGLLGVILQKIYNKSYEELVVQYIGRPLGMKDTRVALRKEDSARLAKGYDADGRYNGPWNFPAAVAGAGAIRSTLADMLKYAAAQADPSLAPEPLRTAIRLTHEQTFTQGGLALGLGWHYIRLGEYPVLFHDGGTGGFRSYLGVYPGKKLAVVILCNSAVAPDSEGNALVQWLPAGY